MNKKKYDILIHITAWLLRFWFNEVWVTMDGFSAVNGNKYCTAKEET